MEGRNGLILTVESVPSNRNPRSAFFRLGYSPMKMASLGVRLSVVTTLGVLLALLACYLFAQRHQPGHTHVATAAAVVLVAGLLLAAQQLRTTIVEESLLVNRDLGVQIETIRLDGKRSYQFLDKHAISAFVFNEGITACRVVYYLAVVVRGQDSLVLAFRNFPGMGVLQKVYRKSHAVLNIASGDVR